MFKKINSPLQRQLDRRQKGSNNEGKKHSKEATPVINVWAKGQSDKGHSDRDNEGRQTEETFKA